MTTALRRRAVFIDVDGTLMKDGHFIPISAVEAIRSARANGHLVFFSTGRGLAELGGPLADIGVDGAVTNGGGFASVGDDLIVTRLLTATEVARLEERFDSRGVHWYFQTYDALFASPGLPAMLGARLESDRFAHRARADAAGVGPDELPFFSVGMKRFDDPSQWDPAKAAKAVILSDDAEAVASLLDELGGEFAVVGGTIPVPGVGSGEIAAAGVNKGATILELLAHLDLDPADAIGIGDNWNDVEMFDVCGVSIAMGNADPAVQALADEVTSSIDDDGIHRALARHGLI